MVYVSVHVKKVIIVPVVKGENIVRHMNDKVKRSKIPTIYFSIMIVMREAVGKRMLVVDLAVVYFANTYLVVANLSEKIEN